MAAGPGSGWEFSALRHRLDLAIATVDDEPLDAAKAEPHHATEIRQAPQLNDSLFAAMPLHPSLQQRR